MAIKLLHYKRTSGVFTKKTTVFVTSLKDERKVTNLIVFPAQSARSYRGQAMANFLVALQHSRSLRTTERPQVCDPD